jgi:LuxR family maltose regulon positive regulatory protein
MKRKVDAPAKISVPRQRKLFKRTRAFAALEKKRASPCIWISGPPGSGKTSLVSDFLIRKRKACILWYQVDSGDQDIANCFYYMRHAARNTGLIADAALLTYSPVFVRDLDTFCRRYFEILYSLFDVPVAVVFDDFHFAGNSHHFNKFITQAIVNLPVGSNIYILSRRSPPPEFGRLRANEQLTVLGWSTLRLSADEVAKIAAVRGCNLIEKWQLEKLVTACRGWVAGLIMLLQTPIPNTRYLGGGRNAKRAIFDYFGHEVFARQETDSKKILMEAALMPTMTAQMVTELTGNENALNLLERLHRRGYFIEYKVEPNGQYQFHPLFREFLLDQLYRTYSADDLHRLEICAARMVENNGDRDAAVKLYAKAGAYEEIGCLISAAAPDYLEQGRLQTIENWIVSLPVSIDTEYPRLNYWLGVCRLIDDPAVALGHFESSVTNCLEKHDETGASLAWAGAVYAILVTWTDFQRLKEWTHVGEKLRREYPDFATSEAEISYRYAMCLAVIFSNPASAKIDALIDSAMKMMHRPQGLSQKLITGNFLLHHFSWMGDISRGQILLEILRQSVEQGDVSEKDQIMWLAAKSAFMLVCGNPDTALCDSREGLELSEASGIYVWRHKLYTVAAHAHLLMAEPAQARKFLDLDAAILHGSENLLDYHHHWLFAWYEWINGRFGHALDRLKGAESILELTGQRSVPLAKCRVGQAIVEFELGNLNRAQTLLEETKSVARQVGSKWLAHQCAVVDATFALEENNQSWLRSGQRAMQLGASANLLSTDWFDHRRMGQLCARLLQSNIEVKHVERVIKSRNLSPSGIAGPMEAWPYPVKIYALGSLQVFRDGEQLTDRPKQQRRVFELLKALIAFGGQNVSETRLTEALWPDAEADDAHNALKTATHRLRVMLGYSEAVLIRNSACTLNPDYCWVDTWEMQRLFQSISTGDGHRDLLRHAIELYRGPLLQDDDAPWILNLREHLQNDARAAIEHFGRDWEMLEDWRAAIDVYENGLKIDECAETLYRRLMVCHERLGNHADAMVTYDRCYRRLSERFGVAPSRVTQDLASDIRQH